MKGEQASRAPGSGSDAYVMGRTKTKAKKISVCSRETEAK